MAVPRVINGCTGQTQGVEETRSSAAPSPSGPGRRSSEPEVAHTLTGDVARMSLAGELTGAARRPLMRVLTDLLLQVHSLHRVELDLSGVTFMNSAGMAVLVQALRMTAPRAIELILVGPTPTVIQPLQHSGLWHRFTMVDTPPEGTAGS
jgi:stage II sporulation protein AA (anti-sigma F factor antagonist)